MRQLLQILAGAACILLLAAHAARAGDMKHELTADLNLFRSHFGQTPYPNKSITLDPEGVHFFLTSETEKPEYTSLYSFFKLGGDFEISVNYDWTPVVVPKDGYGVSTGIRIETNDAKFHSAALARGNFPGGGSAYRVSVGSKGADKRVNYENLPPFDTKGKKGRLILARKKKEVICSAADDGDEEPRELCRIPFTDAAVQRVLIFADPGRSPTDLNAWITNIKMRADEMSHHMTAKEKDNPWWGVFAGLALIVVGTAGFLIFRRLRDGRWTLRAPEDDA
jgi:hypothetical protein